MENISFEIYLRFIWIQTYIIIYFSRRLFGNINTTLSSWCRIFISRSRAREIHSQSLVKILSDKDKIAFKAIEKHR